jgi:hypothetical protein
MKRPAKSPYAEALRILDGYYRAVVARAAEEVVENRDDFEGPYPGRAEEIVDRYGQHLQSLCRLCADLSSADAAARGTAGVGAEAMPVAPSGRPVTPDTPLEAGSPVLAEWQGYWFRARVVSPEDDGTVVIHYEGWDDMWDEAVPRSRLQVADDPGPEEE